MANSLNETLASWSFPRFVKPPDEAKLIRATRELRSVLESARIEAISGRQLEELHEQVRGLVARSESLDRLTRRDLKSLPWVLFLPANSPDRWLARDRPLWQQYSDWLEGPGKARAVVALAHVLIRNWPGNEVYFDRWRLTALRSIEASRARRLQDLRQRCESYHLLDRDGPGRLFGTAFEKRDLDLQLLDRAGLSGQLAFSGFVRTGIEDLLPRVERALLQGSLEPEPLNAFLQLATKPDEEGLRFDGLRLALIKALISPFAEQNPPAEIQDIILEFLMANVGDPRFRRSGWQGLDRGLRDIVMRWLVRMTLDDFFRILDRTAIDRMWRQRKKFWSAYLDKGVITDAWLVLGGKARELARRAQDGQAGWGNLDGYYDHRQSVLLMRLAGLVIAEWSHNGKCCFWKDENQQKPDFYKSGSYSADSLRDKYGADESFVHVHTGAWMERVERYIQRETGVSRLG